MKAMQISELIEQLAELKATFGDLPVKNEDEQPLSLAYFSHSAT